MRKLLPLMLALILAVLPVTSFQSPALAQGGDPAIAAVNWLADQQAEDGSYNNDDVYDTALAAIARGLIDEPDEAAVSWLEDTLATSDQAQIDQLAFAVLAAAANGQDPSALNDGAVVEQFMTQLQSDRGENVLGLCLGLVAINASGQDLPPTALQGLGFLQNDDGGFPFSPGGDSDPGVTAVCLHVLVLAENTEAVDDALAFISDSQSEDGSWGPVDGDDSSDITNYTAIVLTGLTAAGEDIQADWASALGFMMSQRTDEGAFMGPDDEDGSIQTTSMMALVFRGLSFNSIGAAEDTDADDETEDGDTGDSGDSMSMEEGPALDENWLPVADGFGMEELDTADDFFVTVIDPFTDEELYGIEIINWTAEYSYTGYIVENYLPADVLLWMAEQDPDLWTNISDATLELLPEEVISQLPEDVQDRAAAIEE